MLRPRSVAVVGASSRGAGGEILRTLERTGYRGRVELVNPRVSEIDGRTCVPSLLDLSDPVDAAVIALRAERCVAAVADCARAGVRGAVVFANGFAEVGADGERRQAELVEATRGRVALLGPNCMGFFAPAYGTALYLDVVHRFSRPGRIALVTQSGSIGVGAINHTGTFALSAMVSVGNEAIVTTPDVIGFLLHDGVTRVIAIHQEGFRDARALVSVAEEALEHGIPLVLLKTGRSATGARAAMSHTGAVASDDRVVRAVLGARGVTVVDDVDELFVAAEILATGRRYGPRLGAATLSGGHLSLLHDAVDGTGLNFPNLTPEVRPLVEEALGEPRSILNPLDAWSATKDVAQGFDRSLDALTADSSLDAFLITVDTPREPPTSSPDLARSMAQSAVRVAARTDRLTALVTTVVAADDPEAVEILARGGVPRLSGLRASVDALAALVATVTLPILERPPPWEGPLPRTEPEVYAALARFGVATAAFRVCRDRDAAVAAAATLGFPVVLKVISRALLHKSDVGGVVLNVRDAQETVEAYDRLSAFGGEAVLVAQQVPAGVDAFAGGRVDREFGPVVAFGAGGVLVEFLDDIAVLPAPTTAVAVDRLLDRTRLSRLLGGYRGLGTVDRAAFCDAVVGVSRFIAAVADESVSIDVNPIRLFARGAFALDAKLELEDPIC